MTLKTKIYIKDLKKKQNEKNLNPIFYMHLINSYKYISKQELNPIYLAYFNFG